MHRFRLLSALAIGAMLAACSSGANTVPQTNVDTLAKQTYPRMTMSAEGTPIIYMYNKNIELSGQVVPTVGGSVGTRSPESIITGAMTNHGGPVQTAPKIYIVHWGSATQWGSGDVDGAAAYYQSFISGVGGSQWMSSQTQYTQPGGGNVGNASGSYAGTWNDTTDAIPSLTRSRTYQSYIASEAAKAAAHFGDYSVNASYVIMIPHGVSVSGFGTSYCAWHSSTSANGHTIAYTNLPYVADAGSGCGANSVDGVKDGFSIVGGHEQAETETDPQPNTGWLDSGNNETGDKCAWVNLANQSFSTGTFPTQPLWSNSANGCVQ